MNKDLRKLNISMPVTEQSSVIGTPFDPIQQEAAVLIFTGTFCEPCARMSPSYVKWQAEFSNVPAIAVSQEPHARLAHYYEKVKNFINYAISSVSYDTWETLANELNVDGIPHCVILYQGKVLFSGHPMAADYEKTLRNLSTTLAAKAKK